MKYHTSTCIIISGLGAVQPDADYIQMRVFCLRHFNRFGQRMFGHACVSQYSKQRFVAHSSLRSW